MADGSPRGAAYARFSSDMQREESIDAQLRAIEDYARREGIVLTERYIDRAKSGTNDQRPDFMRMIADAERGLFDVIIVHKLDRFARNRYDSAHYKHLIKRSGVKLRSVSEALDDSPESIIMESVLEGMAEYYSKNLGRETMKGLTENALQGKHTGGIPPLGYDVAVDKHYVLNEREAEAVRLIFKMYNDGAGYAEIQNVLESGGYKTKRGRAFGKNSLYEILNNEKYTGTFIFNRIASRDVDHKCNRHSYKPDDEVIRVEGAIPQIIDRETFETAKRKLSERKNKSARYSAKQEYLLSGKIVCGVCGSSYAGNARRPSPDRPLYVYYRCNRKNGTEKCCNPDIRREEIESVVLDYLADSVFSSEALPILMERYNTYAATKNDDSNRQKATIESRLREIDREIANIVNVIAKTGSEALTTRLSELERERRMLTDRYQEVELALSQTQVEPSQIKAAFRRAKAMLRDGTLASRRAIVAACVHGVTVHPDRVHIEVNAVRGFTIETERRR